MGFTRRLVMAALLVAACTPLAQPSEPSPLPVPGEVAPRESPMAVWPGAVACLFSSVCLYFLVSTGGGSLQVGWGFGRAVFSWVPCTRGLSDVGLPPEPIKLESVPPSPPTLHRIAPFYCDQ
jgi:hypothetical protein